MKKNERIPAAKVAVALALLSALNTALAQGIEAPPLVIRSNTQESTIWAQDRVGAPAANGAQSIQSTTGAGAATGTVNATGANTTLNATQVAQPSAVLIAGDAPCESAPTNWDGACTATLPKTFSGLSATVAAAAPHSGSATFTCQSGVWQAPTGLTCQTYCAPAAVAWSACGSSVAGSLEGQSQTINNTNAGYTGSATYTCTAAGTFTRTSETCSAVPPPQTTAYVAKVCTRLGGANSCLGRRYKCSAVVPKTTAYAVLYEWRDGEEWDRFRSNLSGARLCYALLGGTNWPTSGFPAIFYRALRQHSANGDRDDGVDGYRWTFEGYRF